MAFVLLLGLPVSKILAQSVIVYWSCYPKKCTQMRPEPKKNSGFFWLKTKTFITQKLKLDIKKV